MNNLNEHDETLIQELADICCASLTGQEPDFDGRTEKILKSLVMGGLARKADVTLQSELKRRVQDQCSDVALHRSSELNSITKLMQDKFDKISTWESRNPEEKTEAKAANLSSAHDS